MRLRSGDKRHLRKSADRKAQISPVSGKNVFLIRAFRSADFLRWCSSPSATSRAISFSISNSFWYNLTHFFDEKNDSGAGNSIVCFGASIPCHAIWQKQNEGREMFRRAQPFWQRKVWTQRPSRGEKLRCKFLARKSAKLFSNSKVQIFGKERCKIHRQFQRYTDDVTSVSLSLSPSLYYRKRVSASYIVREVHSVREREIQRERERDGSDVIIFALKFAMKLHFPLPKIRTIGDEFTLSLAKSSHFSFLPSHFPSLPLNSRRGHHCGAEIRNEFTLSVAKNCFALFVPTLSNGASRATSTSDRKPKTNDQILPSPTLFFPSRKWIKLIPKTIGNRKRDCAWGGSGW